MTEITMPDTDDKVTMNFNKFAEIYDKINCGIPVQSLSDKHLLAEHREIKRICYRLSVRLLQNKFNDIPADFSTIKNTKIIFKELFWLDKGKYTLTRYLQLYNECKRRGFNVTDFSSNWEIYRRKPEFFNDYNPTGEQISMIQKRIDEKLKIKNQTMKDHDRYNINMDIKYGHLEPIDVPAIVNSCPDKWFNQTLTSVNDSVVRLGIVDGEFHWHKHDEEDEFFFVISGHLLMDLEDRTVELEQYQGITISKGVMHRPRTKERTVVLMVEPRSINPTGS